MSLQIYQTPDPWQQQSLQVCFRKERQQKKVLICVCVVSAPQYATPPWIGRNIRLIQSFLQIGNQSACQPLIHLFSPLGTGKENHFMGRFGNSHSPFKKIFWYRNTLYTNRMGHRSFGRFSDRGRVGKNIVVCTSRTSDNQKQQQR